MNTAGDAWHEALRRLDKLAEVYTGYARIEEIRSWVERGGDGAAEAVDALTGGLAPESPTASTPKAGRWGSGEAETATDTTPDRLAWISEAAQLMRWWAGQEVVREPPTETDRTTSEETP